MRNVRATTTAMTSSSVEIDRPPGIDRSADAGDVDTPTMKSFMPLQVAYPDSASSIKEAMPIAAFRPKK